MDKLKQALTDLRFAEIMIRESVRTLMVLPDQVARATQLVDQMGLGGVITVESSPYLPPGSWFLMDHNAIEAATREAFQGVRFPFR